MARIRTIKPDFFRHVGLYDAEKQSRLPLRLAFAGLWTAADREGRFAWSPRTLKLDCLPHDDIDFSEVLEALSEHGFIVRYEIEGKAYGYIPSWQEHQIINNREMQSRLPAPTPGNCKQQGPRVPHASATREGNYTGEGKGRERKGKDSRSVADATRPKTNSGFEDFWKTYPRRKGSNPKQPALKRYEKAIQNGASSDEILSGARKFAEIERGKIDTEFIPQARKWLLDECWKDFQPTSEEREYSARLDAEMAARGMIWNGERWAEKAA